jgi:DNA-binding transcriptional ArsR family regulator
MDIIKATNAFSALSLETRLKAMRLLIKAGKDGMPAGAISDALDVKQNTMSSHLSVLQNAGLIYSVRDGRVVRYFMNMDEFKSLLTYLLEDCCGGEGAVCRPLINMVVNTCNEENCV